ncbi:MAG: thiamine pyrophosphate-dependent enzyme [Armatimonadota bacterium]
MAQAQTQKIAEQITDFRKGNEMAVIASQQINYHIMGYYPITPSTEIAEELDELFVEGGHNINMIPADGEHGAAGICYGAATGGGRVLNATSSQGLLFAMEQLPVQSGTRFPMVLNVVARAISGPLNIRGDHTDIMMALNAGWIILMARDPQAVYDMNLLAIRLGEHPDVRLPVIVTSDGFFTSHQKRRVSYFKDAETVQKFIGEFHAPITTLDPEHPVTIGPYMNDPDLINNKYQLHLAMEAAADVIPDLFREYGDLSGRYYPVVDAYGMDDAEAAIFLLNSAAETAKDAVDRMRQNGYKVGVVSPNVIRPFPADDIRKILKNTKALMIADRADSFGAHGGNMSLETRAALKDDPENCTICLSRIYGLGGKDFYIEDAEELLMMAVNSVKEGNAKVHFDYYGINEGNPDIHIEYEEAPISLDEASPGINKVTQNPESGEIKAQVGTTRQLAMMPQRIAPGHGACPGCGIFPTVDQFLKGIEGHVVLLFHTGCGMVVTTGYPYSSHRVTYIHNLFQNGSATLSGLVEMYREKKRRGEIPEDLEITFVMVSGDGGMDIGMGPAIGTALRGHPMIILEYDNEGYMNTGNQLSYSTPYGHASSTSHVGARRVGKTFHHKDTAQIMAATGIPYVFTSVEGLATDLVKKGAKAQWHTRQGHFVYGKVLSVCTLSWRNNEELGTKLVQSAVDSCFWPVYEVENGITKITYNPEEKNKRIPVKDWLNMMGKTKHLMKPENSEIVAEIESEIEKRWQRLKARNDNPLL